MIFSIIEKLSLNNWNTSDTKRRLAVFILFTVGLSVYFGFVEGMTRFEHDMSESYAWGKEFQLGYHQHGFYFAWLAGAWMLLVPHELWAYLILSAVNAIIGMVGACLLIKEFDQGLRGRVATSLLILMPNFTFFAYKWAANVPFIALCPWALLFFVRSIQNISIADGIFFGIMSGLGILNKYFAVVYLVCCALVAVIHINRTKYFSSFVPYISVLVTAIVIAPHLWWLINLAGVPDTTPLDYFSAIIGQDFFVTTYEASRAISGLIQASLAPLILYVYFAAARANNSFKLAGRMIGKLYAPRLQPSLYILGLGPFLITVILAFLFRWSQGSNATRAVNASFGVW